MSVTRRRFAAGSGRRRVVRTLGLVLLACAVFLAPLLALAFISGDDGVSLCQSPQPPGDPLSVVVFLDTAHGWQPGGGPHVPNADHRGEAVTCAALRPLDLLFALATDSRPPPLCA